jgi:hypothetical protein
MQKTYWRYQYQPELISDTDLPKILFEEITVDPQNSEIVAKNLESNKKRVHEYEMNNIRTFGADWSQGRIFSETRLTLLNIIQRKLKQNSDENPEKN